MNFLVRPGTIEEAFELSKEIPELQNRFDKKEYQTRLKATHVILIADVAGVPVGFKIGYDRYLDGKIFFGWVGGVHPGYRKLGVAKLLLEKMEVWCRVKGYQVLQFKTLNNKKSMIHFAIDQGFEISDFKREGPLGTSNIYFEKKL